VEIRVRGGDSTIDTEDAAAPSVSDGIVNTIALEDDLVSDEVTVQADAKESTDEESSSTHLLTPTGETSSGDEAIAKLREGATQKRSEGKSLHDSGELHLASVAFHEAACLLQEALQAEDGTERTTKAEDVEQIAEECATCRLHEALCLFKNGEAERCVEVCSDVLGDGVLISASVATIDERDVDSSMGDDNRMDEIAADTAAEECTDDFNNMKEETDNSEVEEKSVYSAPISSNNSISSQVRARAHLRRSKARLALGDLNGALEDGEHINCMFLYYCQSVCIYFCLVISRDFLTLTSLLIYFCR
jgi:hypothetical protein